MELGDAELVERCRARGAGAQDAFRALYQRHAPPLSAYLRGILGEDDAADALQETFLRCYRSLDRYDPKRPLRPWLLGIGINVARDRLRGEARRPTEALNAEPVALDPPAERAERNEARALLSDALGDLPAEAREVFLLKQGQGMTYQAVADVVGCSVRTAKNRMRSAQTLLAASLRRGLAEGGAA